MKYLIAVDDCFLDRPGGMGRVAWDIAMLMRDRGHDVAMVAARPQPGGEAAAVTTRVGIRILRYSRPILPAWYPLRARRTVGAAAEAIRAHLGGESWDVVHMHSPFTGMGALQALGPAPRYVYTVHSPAVMEQQINWANQGAVGRLKLAFGLAALRRIEHTVLRAAGQIHTLSKYTRNRVHEFYGLGDRVVVVPHWRRPELRRALSKSEARRCLGWPVDETILFSVRKLAPRYGLDVAIRAIAPLTREAACRFVIAGDGPSRVMLTDLACSLGVGERVQFTGRLDDTQLALAYQAADLFVLPTAALECFGLIVIEALAFGCPIVSTDAGAIPELMQPILPNFIVPAGHGDALESKIRDVLAGRITPPPAAALAAYVERSFGREHVTSQLVALLEGRTLPGATQLAS